MTTENKGPHPLNLTVTPYSRIDEESWRGGVCAYGSSMLQQRNRPGTRQQGVAEERPENQASGIVFLVAKSGDMIPVTVAPDGSIVKPHHQQKNAQRQITGLIADRRARPELFKSIVHHINTFYKSNTTKDKSAADLSVDESPKIHGEIIERLSHGIVVRFNIAGESEEREFFWDELAGAPESWAVGSAVIADARLHLAPPPPSDEVQDAEFQKIREKTLRDLKLQGVDPQTVIGSESTDELCERSARVWAENLKGHSKANQDEG